MSEFNLLCQAQVNMTRGWCYTINNFTEEDRDGLRSLECVYNIFGYERGAEGTPHLQGYVHFKSHKTLKGVKKMMPRAHLEPRKGTIDQAVDYCKKKDFEEFESSHCRKARRARRIKKDGTKR